MPGFGFRLSGVATSWGFVSTVLVAELGSLFVSCAWWVNVRSWLTVGVQDPRPVHLSNASRAQSLRPLRGRESSSASHQRPSGNAAASFPGEMSTGNSRVGSLAPHGRSRPRLSYLVAVQRRRATWRSLARATEITKTACRIPMTCTVRTSNLTQIVAVSPSRGVGGVLQGHRHRRRGQRSVSVPRRSLEVERALLSAAELN